MNGKLLLVSTNRKSRERLSGAIREAAPSLAVDVAARATEAVERLAEGFDAAVCCVDSVDELTLVIRLRKRAPDLPIVALSSVARDGFETLARAQGADAVLRAGADVSGSAKAVVLAMSTARLARQNRARVSRSKELVEDIRRLVSYNRDLVGTALGLSAAEQDDFTTLLVEDDPLQKALLQRLFQRAKLPPFLRNVSTVTEAIDYLSGRGFGADRQANPFPSLIVSDLKLPGGSGLDLLRWVRSSPETRGLGFLMLSTSDRESDILAAYEAGADLYLVKSNTQSDVVDFVRGVYVRFMAEKTGARIDPR